MKYVGSSMGIGDGKLYACFVTKGKKMVYVGFSIGIGGGKLCACFMTKGRKIVFDAPSDGDGAAPSDWLAFFMIIGK